LGLLLVLHEISQIRKYADRVLFIHDKSIYRDGDPQRILTQELVRKHLRNSKKKWPQGRWL